MTNHLFLGVDFGGTHTKLALGTEVVSERVTCQMTTPADLTADHFVQQVFAAIDDMIEANCGNATYQINAAGIGVPGPIDRYTSTISRAVNLPFLEHFPFREAFAQRYATSVVLERDSNCAAMGEYLFGAGRGAQIMVMYTLGTGVGGGVVVGGRLLKGAAGYGGELGHAIVTVDGELCKCGQRGCLAQYCSERALREQVSARSNVAEGGSLVELQRARGRLGIQEIIESLATDQIARELFDQIICYLAIGCINMCRIFDPSVIVIGGGGAKAGGVLADALIREVRGREWKLSKSLTEIRMAELGEFSGAIGAVAMARTFAAGHHIHG
jgi:glucokinase